MSLFKNLSPNNTIERSQTNITKPTKTGIRQMIGWKEEVSLEESVITNWPLSHRET